MNGIKWLFTNSVIQQQQKIGKTFLWELVLFGLEYALEESFWKQGIYKNRLEKQIKESWNGC